MLIGAGVWDAMNTTQFGWRARLPNSAGDFHISGLLGSLDGVIGRRGHVFAQWLVAHGERYHVLSVIFADQIWTSWASSLGWRDYIHPSGDTRNPVLRHLDHVHVAVESGRPYRG